MRSQSYNTESRDQERPSTTQVQTNDAKTKFPVKQKLSHPLRCFFDLKYEDLNFCFEFVLGTDFWVVRCR